MKVDLRKFATDPMAFFAALMVPSAHGVRRFGDIMADHQREWFLAIVPALLAVAAGKNPPIGRFWSERTKGGSKDSDCACVLLWLLAFSPRKLDMVVGAADKDQAGELKKAAADILRLNPWLAKRVEVQAWILVCKPTGSECTIVASDIAGSHGARPSVTVMNELSHVTKEEFAQNLLDNATKKPHGIVIVATNAGFQGSWQETWRKMAMKSERWHFHSFCQPAPWLSQEEIDEAAQRNSTSRFNRLYWGDWVSQAGDALDEADIQAAIDPDLAPGIRPDANEFFVAGLDLGIRHDHSALVVIAGDRSTLQLRLAHAESWRPNPTTGKVDLMAVESAVLRAHEQFGFDWVGYDLYQAALMAQRLEQQQVPMKEVHFAGASLNLMASTLLDVFRSRRIQLYDYPPLIADLSRLTIVEKSYGHRLEATRNADGHADLATALAIALPIAVETADDVPIVLTSMVAPNANETPFQSALRELEERKREYEEEQREFGGPSTGDDEWRSFLRHCGRIF